MEEVTDAHLCRGARRGASSTLQHADCAGPRRVASAIGSGRMRAVALMSAFVCILMAAAAPHAYGSGAIGLGPPAVAPARVEPQGAAGYDEPTRYFYRGLPYGSDATFHPVRELINGAFGIFQVSSKWKTLDQIHWRNGLDITWRSISHPFRTTRAYGTRDFLTSEVFPGQFDMNSLQYLPNYHLHMIGGGARNRAFTEWYRAHGFPHPWIMAMATTVFHSFAVETVEHQAETGPTVDPVADMLFFDPAGAILFTSDRVSRFFSRTLNMAIWSGQPMYNPVLNTVENAGENYGLHLFLNKDDRIGIFMYWGMSDLVGVTVRRVAGLDWSVGLGGMVSELHEEERGAGMSALYARIKLDVGGFVHRNNSLLASVHVSQSWTQRLRASIFPGVVSWHGISPGVYVGVRGADVILGMSVISIPVGLAASN